MAVEALVVGHGVWELYWTKLDGGGWDLESRTLYCFTFKNEV
jgi:hypothetical protein